MDTVVLNRPDRAFVREVEKKSGQPLAACYQCGNCTAGCPMAFTYDYSPSRLMRLIQAGQRDTVLSSSSIWMCASCEACSQRCPNNIQVAAVLESCRHMARLEKKCAVPRLKKFWDSFIFSVGLFGRTFEAGVMAGYMLLTGRFFTDLDIAPMTLIKGKLPLFPHRTKGRKEVAAILRRFKEGKASPEAALAALEAEARESRETDQPVKGGAL